MAKKAIEMLREILYYVDALSDIGKGFEDFNDEFKSWHLKTNNRINRTRKNDWIMMLIRNH